jgi:hypothetical protein
MYQKNWRLDAVAKRGVGKTPEDPTKFKVIARQAGMGSSAKASYHKLRWSFLGDPTARLGGGGGRGPEIDLVSGQPIQTH